MRVKFGPTTAVFRGEAKLDFDAAQRRCVIEGRGVDHKGASRALASGTITVTGTDETLVTVEGKYDVSGPLETFAKAGGVHVARALLAEFASNVSQVVRDRRGVSAATSPSSAGEAASEPAEASPRPPMSAWRLLGSTLAIWLRSLFRAGRAGR
jgi:hypothetical protein